MKKFVKTVLVFSALITGSAFAHAFEPTVGVEVQMTGAKAGSGIDNRLLLGVTGPAVGVEVHLAETITAAEAATVYDPVGVPAVWQQLTPSVGVEKHLTLQ